MLIQEKSGEAEIDRFERKEGPGIEFRGQVLKSGRRHWHDGSQRTIRRLKALKIL
jgi:hypothetical protein